RDFHVTGVQTCALPISKGSSTASACGGGIGGGGPESPFRTLTVSWRVPMPSPSRSSWPLLELPAAYRVTGPFQAGACQRKLKLVLPLAKALGCLCEISPPITCTSLPVALKLPASRDADTPRPPVTPGPPLMVTV